MQRLLFFIVALLGTAGAACQATPAQDSAQVRQLAFRAANSQMEMARLAYLQTHKNIAYKVNLGNVNIQGNQATVSGNIWSTLTSRSTGKTETHNFRGTVTLRRVNCVWKATGYRQG